MAAGAVRRAQLSDSRRVQIIDRFGAVRAHRLWDGNPRIAQSGEEGDFQRIVNGSGVRPYIVGKTDHRWTWRECDNLSGELYLTPAETAFAEHFDVTVIIEPDLKQGASPNKRWPYWSEFVRLARKEGIAIARMGATATRMLPDVRFIATPDFRRACAILVRAKAYVGHEGAFHHAAAALGIPAVVIRGGYVSGRVTGYAGQHDLFVGDDLGCGMRTHCEHCAEAMRSITPEQVLHELRGIL